MSNVKTTTIEKMQAKRAQLDARIQQLKNKQTSEERKKDTRRKILVGAFFIQLLGGDLKRVGNRLKAAGMLQPRDFELFGLSGEENKLD